MTPAEVVALVAMARAASHDERLSDGMLYRRLADAIETLMAGSALLSDSLDAAIQQRDEMIPPVPLGDGRHDIGDDLRAAIVRRLMDEWRHDPDLTPKKVKHLSMWAGASVRALLHELGTLKDWA